jgi:purine-nucleoside phosphorylase
LRGFPIADARRFGHILPMPMHSEWSEVDAVARFLRTRLGDPPEVAVVLGSGLGVAAAALEDARSIAFHEIPGWPRSTVEGHAGEMRRGTLGGVEVLLQLGRVHYYEGYAVEEVVRPVRAEIAWGARAVILTNAAGGLNPGFRAGSLMAIEDHINLTGRNPLRGANDASRGPRFPDMTDAWDGDARAALLDCAREIGVTLVRGVYAGLTGPSYETPAEVRMLRALGADAVGMSTVLEALAARHMGAKLAGLSCITNAAAAAGGPKLTHEDVQRAAASAAADTARLLSTAIPAIARACR